MPKVTCKTTTMTSTEGVGSGDGTFMLQAGEFTAEYGQTAMTPPTINGNATTTPAAVEAGKDNHSNSNNNNSRQLKTATIKKEKVDSPSGEQVFHRKSERRRVARDIFLIFEEQPSSRRRGARGGSGANRKPARPAKPKFGHLKVEEPNTYNHNNNNSKPKGLLRDIKNEPKCYLNTAAAVHVAAAAAASAALPAVEINSSNNSNNSNNHVNRNNNTNIAHNVHNNNNNKRTKTQKAAVAVTVSTVNATCGDSVIGNVLNESKPETPPPPPMPPPSAVTQPTTNMPTEQEMMPPPPPPLLPPMRQLCRSEPQCNGSVEPIARVNPIFLWVKQDDTRIVEVRCEDYDKRNRIRITKTTNGWRAIPRTDPTSSRIVKYFQTTTTPLLKVKREVYETASREMHERLNDIAFNNLKNAPPATPLPERVYEMPAVEQMQQQLSSITQENYTHMEDTNADAVTTSAPPPLQIAKNQKPRGGGRKKKNKKTKAKSKKIGIVSSTAATTTLAVVAPEVQPPVSVAVATADVLTPPLLLPVSKSERVDEDLRRLMEPLLEANCDLGTSKQSSPLQSLTPQLLDEIDEKSEGVEEEGVDHTQTYQHVPTLELQLCPKTGLFLPQNSCAAIAAAACDLIDACAVDAISLPSGGGTDSCGDMLVPDLVNCEFVCDRDDDDDNNKQQQQQQQQHPIAHDSDDEVVVQDVAATTVNIIQNLDAETKNLKDLLDDADLLQHCGVGDNINSGAELIDSLVKRSCENNLIQEASTNELLKDAFAVATAAATAAATVASNHLHHHHDLVRQLDDAAENRDATGLPTHLIDSVSEPPKCLSFNEAGEIEGLNCELFQSTSLAHNFIETFDVDDVDDKEPSSSPLIGVPLDDVPELTHSSETRLQHQGTTDLCDEREEIHARQEDDDEDDVDKQSDVRMEDETPKDLSYKKREEVCPPSESRSQCAVTSSSDVVKSPTTGSLSLRQDEQLPPTAALESTSETIKNLILEQFIKLNALNGIAATPTATKQQQQQQQLEPIDLGKHRESAADNFSDGGGGDGIGSGYAASTNYIDTVVIDDNSDEEPMKKRLRNTPNSSSSSCVVVAASAIGSGEKSVAPPTTTVPLIIDKDPDPLTQLQLLIRNTAWKVPDPILVPKDRLGAVLASPAREIPLLITTRPELRLPEAFAYPEIIQNPNILVISMAQLEAILKNEMEMEKTNAAATTTATIAAKQQQQQQPHRTIAACDFSTATNAAAAVVDNNNLRKLNQVQDLQMTCAPLQQNEPKIQMQQQQQQSKEISTKCSHVESSSSNNSSSNNAGANNNNLASDINAATLAVLNQMLWLPYFGQLSQEFMKSLKEPVVGLQNKFASLLPPPPPPSIFNHHQFGLQHLDELYKTYIKQITNLKHMASPSHQLQPQSLPQSQQTLNYANTLGAFQNPVELAIFQKILQHQMHNFLNMNPLGTDSSSSTASSSQKDSMVKQQLQQQQQHSSNEHSSNLALMNSIEQQKRSRKSLANQPTPPASTFATEHNSISNLGSVIPEKSHCLKRIKSNCDNSLADNSETSKFTGSSSIQKQQQVLPDNKPRLTCKSLSNLLEPENMTSATAATAAVVPLINLTTENIRNPNAISSNTTIHESGGNKQMDSKQIPSISKESNCLPASDSTFRSARTNSNKVVLNPILNSFDSVSKQRKRNIHFVESSTMGATAAAAPEPTSSVRSSAGGAIDALNAESNPALWHPLFGSNPKPGYSSPWQWTTVTATGE